ncbi:MAG: FAD-binding oxidoreductase [Synechococcales cyanobacterium T60_A2020_003]|nr:FAD-binding oxidoreductase [Synechococcales cyanobacterium T60_A2020_003]
MTNSYDWIVVGNGFAGAALSYELVRLGFSVLVLEQDAIAHNATRFSYGGIPYWSATTPDLQTLFTEGIDRHRQLSDELEKSTEFREVDLLLTVSPEDDSEAIATQYAHMSIPPTRIRVDEALDIEPLLNPASIIAAFTVRHGHVNPMAMLYAYNQAFLRLGGTLRNEQVMGLTRMGDRMTGVQTPNQTYSAGCVAVCAGGLTRSLLKQVEISVPCYYSKAEVIEAPPVDLQLQTLVMPARIQRFGAEKVAGATNTASLWDEPGHELAPPVLDPGIVQFPDRHLCIGQLSRMLTDPNAVVNAAHSEEQLRTAISAYIPALKDIPGQWHSCIVAFSSDQKPLIGSIANWESLFLFSGFSSPFAMLPPLARRFAQAQAGTPDALLPQFSPNRFDCSAS